MAESQPTYTATRVANCGPTGRKTVSQVVWKIDGPEPHFVKTSTAIVGHKRETLVFQCDERGKTRDHTDLPGSHGEAGHSLAVDGYLAWLNADLVGE